MVLINLVAEIDYIPSKPAKYREKYYNIRKCIWCIHNLFYEEGFIPISSVKIAQNMGYSVAGKIVSHFLKPNFHFEESKRKTDPKKKPKLISYQKENRCYSFYPVGMILKCKKSNEIFFPEVPNLKEIILDNSSQVCVNICNPSIQLNELLKKYETEKLLVLDILFDIAKKWSSYSKNSRAELDDLIGDELFKRRAYQKKDLKLYKIGNLELNFVKWFGTGEKGDEFTCTDVTCEYSDIPLYIPLEMQSLIEKRILERQEKSRINKQVFDNNPGYRLIGIKYKRPYLPEMNARKKQLTMFFGPTDFYTSSATNLSVHAEYEDEYNQKTSLNKKYVSNQDVNDPAYLIDSKLANMFGIALATITADNKILLQSRSHQVYMGKNTISLATAENMIRDMDADENKNPDLFKTACRCLKEEIRVDVKREDCVFLAFGIRVDNFLPQALGIVRIKEKSTELNFLTALDSWEGKNFTEDFTFEALKRYIEEPVDISPTAKLTILLALINEYGYEEIKEKVKSITEIKKRRL